MKAERKVKSIYSKDVYEQINILFSKDLPWVELPAEDDNPY